MPYCTRPDRRLLDEHPDEATLVGSLTYVLQHAVESYLVRRADERTSGLSYADLGEVLAAIEGLKADFVDRVLLPYERKKRMENGDVWMRLLPLMGIAAGPA